MVRQEPLNASESAPLAFVIGEGNTDITRALGIAGIRCVAMASATDSARFSRYVVRTIPVLNSWREPHRLVETLIEAGQKESDPPVLIYQGDGNALVVSRFRDVLAKYFKFAIPSAELVETLNDKLQFQALSTQLDLPVPAAVFANPTVDPEPFDLPFPFPVVLKPTQRKVDHWSSTGAKATLIENEEDLTAVWSELRERDASFMVQELIPGAESSVVSFHAYVDENGAILGEFTGEKIRTKPAVFGHSCSVRVVNLPDVARVGRELIQKLNFTGVVKFDFKRRQDDGLALFEVNTKFNLWHLPGAIAGVNLPALAYHDLVGNTPIGGRTIERENVVWCKLWDDLPMALGKGMSPLAWLRWARDVDSWRDLAIDDPLAALGIPLTVLRRGVGRLAARRG